MSRAKPTDEEEVSLFLECTKCGAQPGYWCNTVSGLVATALHGPRTYAYNQGYGAGFQDAEDGLRNYVKAMDTERLLDYRQCLLAGKRW